MLHEFFSWGVMMEWLGVKRLKLFEEERRKMVEIKATLNSIIARFEEGWWSRFDGRKAGFGLRLDLVYQGEMMFGYIANLLFND